MKRRRFNLLYLLVGGTVVVTLFAALLVPPFIDWNQYRGWFETEAERILGQPVTVRGDAEVRLLPVPVVVFNQVEIGDVEGAPMLAMERLSARLELPSLMSGNINLDEIVLERPILKLTVDGDGQLDWLIGPGRGPAMDLAGITLQSLEIRDGTVAFHDERSGAQLQVGAINTTRVEAGALVGPWTVEGDLVGEGIPAHFLITTGELTNGSLRVMTDIELGASAFSGRFRTGGTIEIGEAGLAYTGEFQHASYTPGSGEPDAPAPQVFVQTTGHFELTSFTLALDNVAVEPVAPGTAAVNLTGAGSVTFGTATRFEAQVATRQIDLDRLLGGGPTAPVSVATGLESVIGWASGLTPPSMRGDITLRVPSMLVNAGAVEEIALVASSIPGGWEIDRFEAVLPGDSMFSLQGTLATTDPGFIGEIVFRSEEPPSFASWIGRAGAASDLDRIGANVREATIRPGSAEFRGLELQLEDGTILGSVAWTDRTETSRARLDVNVFADILSLPAVRDLAGLFGDPASLSADKEFSLVVAADEVTAEGVSVGAVDAALGYDNDTLLIERLTIGDLAGARLEASGQIATPLTDPTGTLEARLEAASLAGVAEVAAALAPDLPLTAFLERTAPLLEPASLVARIEADAGSDKRLLLQGMLGTTTVDATFTTAGSLVDWRTSPSTASITLNAAETTALIAQLGLETAPLPVGPTALSITAEGTIADGLAATVKGVVAGVDLDLSARAALAASGRPEFRDGVFTAASADVDPLLRLAGLNLPGVGLGNPVSLSGDFALGADGLRIGIASGRIVDRSLSGAITFTREAEALQANGALTLDVLDLGWVLAANIGTTLEPLAEPAEGTLWSLDPFAGPRLPDIRGTVDLTAGRIDLAEGFAIADAAVTLAIQPELVSLDVARGAAFGGEVAGALAIRNSGGEVGMSGRLSLAGADLAPLIWHGTDGTPVAEGKVDLAFDFEAVGRSPAGLVGALSGSGTFDITDGSTRGVDVGAFEQAIAEADADRLLTDEELGGLFAERFDAGALAFARAGGTFTIIGGLVRAPNIATEIETLAASGALSFDLNLLTIQSDWRLALAGAEENEGGALPQVSLAFAGPLAAPARTIETASLGTYLTIRSLTRQIERMESLAGRPTPALDPVPTAATPPAAAAAPETPVQGPMPPPAIVPPAELPLTPTGAQGMPLPQARPTLQAGGPGQNADPLQGLIDMPFGP